MSYKEDYLELKECFLSFKRNNYFEKFNSGDIFCVKEKGKNDCALMTFIDQFFGDTLGLQLFYTKDGLNYVHDILSCMDETSVTIGDCDSIVAVYKKKNQLTVDDLAFLKMLDQKPVNKLNLICYRFQKGMKSRCCTKKEISILSLYGVFLASLIPNEHQDIVNAFLEGNSVLAELDINEKRYSAFYQPLPYLQIPLTSMPVNEPFVEDYKNRTYLNEDCYLYTSYLPVIIKDTKVRPILLYFYFLQSNRMELKYILDEPKEYKNCIYGILDDVFDKVGLPAKMVINNRDLYYILRKTLTKMNIEVTFERENNVSNKDYVSQVISRIYEVTQDSEMESKETITMIVEIIQDALKGMDNEYLDDEDLKDEDYVS